MKPTLDEIRQRHNAVKLDIRRIEDDREGRWPCPVCDECPFCDGDNEVDGKVWVYNSLAAGIQVFGIGDDLNNLEAFAKHAYDDIQVLLQTIEELQAASK